MAEVQDNLIQENKNWIWVFILTDYGGGEKRKSLQKRKSLD